jgi:fructokinase
MFGAIEAGGTKFVCAIGTGPADIETVQIPTTTPAATIESALDFFRRRRGELEAIGIASFGPVDLNPDSWTYGYITSTPKAGWRNCDLAGPIRKRIGVPVGFDTDVNGAALGEMRWGAARGLSDFLYLTVGTGIGGGAVSGGRVLHGLSHPEMGHIRVPHDRVEDPFEGCCPFHRDCLEGLASGPAIEARWGVSARDLPLDHPGFALEARYLALGMANWVCTLSPQRIIVGGGVMQQSALFAMIRAELLRLLNGYIDVREITDCSDQYIMAPGLGSRAGVLGALVLAEEAAGRAD